METPDKIESALRNKLIPRGFSEAGLDSIHAMLDELGGEAEAAEVMSPSRPWWMVAAAVIALALGLSFLMDGREAAPEMAQHASEDQALALISESEGIVSAEPEDRLVSDEYGRLMKAWNVRVVSEEIVKDSQTGHQVRVVFPRNERVLVPVSTF